MIKVSADGDLQIITPCLRLFSDSFEQLFYFVFYPYKDNFVYFRVVNDKLFSHYICFALISQINFLPCFCWSFDIGDFAFDIENEVDHEETVRMDDCK